MMRFRLRNSGKTPALKIATSIQPQLSAAAPKEPNWRLLAKNRLDTTVFPDDASQYIDSSPFWMGVDEQLLLKPYQRGSFTYYTWARVYYCDVNRRLHWTQMCTAHVFGPNTASELTRVTFCGPQKVDDGLGPENHPECS
jgi:hypothetical protein